MALLSNQIPGIIKNSFSSVHFSHSAVSDSLQPHGLQHVRLSWLSPTLEAYSNSCPLSRWCHPTISFSVIPFSSHHQSFPAPGSFQMSQLFTLGGQSIGASASASVLQMNIQDWFPLASFAIIFSHSEGCLFTFAYSFLCCAEAFNLILFFSFF